ncbi:MAG: Druantia anti-phage system protein DruA [Acidimicrobiales bacterium]
MLHNRSCWSRGRGPVGSSRRTRVCALSSIPSTRSPSWSPSTKAQSRRWRELVSSYHYLGYTPFPGAQLRYLAESPSGTLGAFGLPASAWKCAPHRRLHRLGRGDEEGSPAPRRRERPVLDPA